MTILPVDSYIREGFSKQMIEQFRCPAAFATSVDELRTLLSMQGNSPVEYPYIFLRQSSVSMSKESYNPNRLSRQGIPVTINSDNTQFQMARIIPANFEIEATFHTNRMDGNAVSSVNGFVRRWLFASRNGSLQFNVDYGLTKISVSYTLSDSVPTPPRESPTDQESVYKVVATATIHGYVSEPELGTRGRINQILLADAHPTEQTGSQFFKF